MDLTPPSLTRSPVSPSNTLYPSDTSSLGYPSPGLFAQQYNISSTYELERPCSMAHPLGSDTSPPESRASSEWSAPSIAAQSSSSNAIPNVLSLDYDPFASYDSSIHAPYGHGNVYSLPPGPQSAGIGAPSHSPGAVALPSPQTPFSSSSKAAPPFPQGGRGPASLPWRAKAEGRGAFGQQPETASYAAARSAPAFPGPPAAYVSDSELASWPRSDADAEPLYPGPSDLASAAYQGTARQQPGHQQQHEQQQQQQQLKFPRPRRVPRRLTTREEANFQCEVKGCGKLFSRSYNFKAHMETHDEKREYPFPCQVANCNNKFVRKTDLQRHHQSVHAKERNHKCDYCGRLFARKDTLRRHMEDGCSRRFDLGTLDLQSDAYNTLYSPRRSVGAMPGDPWMAPLGSLPPVSGPSSGSTAMLAPESALTSREGAAGSSEDEPGPSHGWSR